MRLRMLGTAGYHPNELRHTSCYMLPAQGFVLDAGTGFFRVRDHLCTPSLHVFLKPMAEAYRAAEIIPCIYDSGH